MVTKWKASPDLLDRLMSGVAPVRDGMMSHRLHVRVGLVTAGLAEVSLVFTDEAGQELINLGPWEMAGGATIELPTTECRTLISLD